MKKILTYNNGLKKSLGFVVLLMMAMLPALVWGEPVGQEAARQKAAAFLSGRAQARGTRATADQQLSVAYTSDEYHVFNRGEHDGFVIVSGDDCAPDILGYSDSGRFDKEHMPDNLQAWMNGYAEQIRMLRATGVKHTAPAKTRAGDNKKDIAPLLTSEWGQRDPYWLETPINNNKQCQTGCVATAMAQIMYYWYKKTGYQTRLITEIPEYVHEVWSPVLESLPAPATFDWAHMTDVYNKESTDTEKQAVAKLMKYCGYAVTTDYDNSSPYDSYYFMSRASPKDVPSALKTYFGYKTSAWLMRKWYKSEEWIDAIYTELAAQRPVLYSLTNSYFVNRLLRYAIVCDGYQRADGYDWFHINWGDDGVLNGYFRLFVSDYNNSADDVIFNGYAWNQGMVVCHPTEDYIQTHMPKFFNEQGDIECLNIEVPKVFENYSSNVRFTLKNTDTSGRSFSDEVYFVFSNAEGKYWENVAALYIELEPGETKEITIPIKPVCSDLHKIAIYNSHTSNGGDYLKYDRLLKEVEVEVEEVPNLNGGVSIIRNGMTLTYELIEDLKDINLSQIHTFWLRSNPDGNYSLISDKTVYNIQKEDVDNYVLLVFSAEQFDGIIYSYYKVTKSNNNEMIVQPKLGVNDNSQVYVDYAVPSQEYIILSYKKDIANLTASDWANAVSPTSSGKLVMGGTKGCTNYVYTRKKETDFTLPGNNVASDQIYLGDPTTVLQGIRMNVALMEKEGNETFFSPIDKEDLGAYYVKYGDVLRIKVSPLPETATFNGINASRWITKIVDGYPCGGFFANYQCTQELEEGQSYKEVYYKAWKHMNYNEVIAEITSGGPNSVYIDKFYLHVANEDDVIIMDSYRTEDVTIGVGEKRTGIQVNTRPLKATLSSAYAFVANSISSEGKEPKVTFDNETRTMTVDATEADAGTYYYTVYQCGNTMSNKIRVDVTTPPIESVEILGDDNILAERGATIQMDMLVTPVNAVAGVVIWSVDDESIATITNEGVLTIKDDAPRGVPTKVTLLVDAIYMDECEVMVPLLTPTLWYDEVNYEAHVGKPFTAPTLNNPQGLTITYSSSDDAVAKVDKTTGAVTPVGAGQAFIYADFKGNADYEPGDACYLITVYAKGDTNGDWTVDDDDITAISDYIKTGEAAGINLDAADMNGDNKVDATDLVLLIKEIK